MWRQFLLMLTLLSVHAAKAGPVTDIIAGIIREESRKDAVCKTPPTEAATKISVFINGYEKDKIYFEEGNVVFYLNNVCWRWKKAEDVALVKTVLIKYLNGNGLGGAEFRTPDKRRVIPMRGTSTGHWNESDDVKKTNELLRKAKSFWESQAGVVPENFIRSHWDFIDFLLHGDRVMFYLMGEKVIMELGDMGLVDRDGAKKLIGDAVGIGARAGGCEAKFDFGTDKEGNEVVKWALTRFIEQLPPSFVIGCTSASGST
eukprot:CAMPEP_0113849842 /NCGR_PEP_ID=MMETSP0372-20130328/3422_1 /TAXON_ID=340204 /ORGANISM="Lankesteria abbotti" /LENGTH=258 /DNA_ID=CAMNT_0000819811 /DNA_START=215 /DNA_END=987 /DNA_ORIENTATION=- /assembly_acc=CAM_ASM_000359